MANLNFQIMFDAKSGTTTLKTLEDEIQNVSKSAKKAGESISDSFSGLGSFITDLTPIISNIGDISSNLVEKMIPALSQTTLATIATTGAIAATTGAFNTLAQIKGPGWVGIIVGILSAIPDIIKNWDDIKKFFSSIFSSNKIEKPKKFESPIDLPKLRSDYSQIKKEQQELNSTIIPLLKQYDEFNKKNGEKLTKAGEEWVKYNNIKMQVAKFSTDFVQSIDEETGAIELYPDVMKIATLKQKEYILNTSEMNDKLRASAGNVVGQIKEMSGQLEKLEKLKNTQLADQFYIVNDSPYKKSSSELENEKKEIDDSINKLQIYLQDASTNLRDIVKTYALKNISTFNEGKLINSQKFADFIKSGMPQIPDKEWEAYNNALYNIIHGMVASENRKRLIEGIKLLESDKTPDQIKQFKTKTTDALIKLLNDKFKLEKWQWEALRPEIESWKNAQDEVTKTAQKTNTATNNVLMRPNIEIPTDVNYKAIPEAKPDINELNVYKILMNKEQKNADEYLAFLLKINAEVSAKVAEYKKIGYENLDETQKSGYLAALDIQPTISDEIEKTHRLIPEGVDQLKTINPPDLKPMLKPITEMKKVEMPKNPIGEFVNQLEKDNEKFAVLVPAVGGVAQAFTSMIVDGFKFGKEGWADITRGIGEMFKTILNMGLQMLEAQIWLSRGGSFAKAISTFGVSLITDAPWLVAAEVALQVAKGLINAMKFAAGGLIDRPTYALMGERGDELVAPKKDFLTIARELLVKERIQPNLAFAGGMHVTIKLDGQQRLRGNDIVTSYDVTKKLKFARVL